MPPELAEVNVALLRAPLTAPELGAFVAAVDPLLRLAEASPGFVWRLPGGHDGVDLVTRPTDGRTAVVNVSIWTSYEALHAFTYRSRHGAFVHRRADWFVPGPQPSAALWWVPPGDRPTADHALRRLALLRRYGPTPQAFTARRRFTPVGHPLPRRRTERA